MKKNEFIVKLRSIITKGDFHTLENFCVNNKRGIIPNKLFKYASFSNYEVSNLLNNQLYLNNPRNFNDPFDCWYPKNQANRRVKIDIIQKVMNIYNDDTSYEEFLKQNPSLKKQNRENRQLTDEDSVKEADKISDKLGKSVESSSLGDSYQTTINEELEKVRIVCLSEYHPSNLLMWSHYANYHKGLCFEYDFRQCNDDTFNMLYPVIYHEKSSSIIVKYNENRLYDFHICDLFRTLLFKSSEWEYEQEWRLIGFQSETSNDGIIHKTPLPSRIYIGVYADNNAKIEQVVSFANSNNIPISKMSHSNNSFLLTENKI